MAFQYIGLLRLMRKATTLHRTTSDAAISQKEIKINKLIQYKTENNLVYLEDPDKFGTLSYNIRNTEDKLEEENDIKEEEYHKNAPLKSQKLTIRQYAELIKQYISLKKLKEAIDVLEVRMLTIDRVKPENYLYNILIGACAEVGYTKKAFKLYNDMKRRALKPTGDTYTCLFQACVNSPWAENGLKNAHYLRDFMVHKGIEPNITNFNAMIKAFGRCGDLNTAFKIVDEMISKKIKIRVHTFNHLLHACITDKKTGLRHALVVWRKMLRMKEKPNLYSFNLMLKCVKDCNLGTKADVEELICILRENIAIGLNPPEQLQIESSHKNTPLTSLTTDIISFRKEETCRLMTDDLRVLNVAKDGDETLLSVKNKVTTVNQGNTCTTIARRVPNLLSRVIQMQQVLALQEVHTLQEKFAVIGGADDFLNEMSVYSVEPDIKTFTQMLPLLSGTREAENKLLETMKAQNIKADIDFYNNLIKNRCLRSDYDGAFDILNMIENENKIRKKKHPLKKKIQLKFNVMTYGVLALACRTKESAEKLLNQMRENKLKINIEILGTLLKNGAIENQFDYVLYVMKLAKEENIKVNQSFLKHLEKFCEICLFKVQQISEDKDAYCAFVKSFNDFSNVYKAWLKEINVEEALKSEHPWQQFKVDYPETIQRTNSIIQEPKKFYKRSRKYVPFVPKL